MKRRITMIISGLALAAVIAVPAVAWQDSGTKTCPAGSTVGTRSLTNGWTYSYTPSSTLRGSYWNGVDSFVARNTNSPVTGSSSWKVSSTLSGSSAGTYGGCFG